MNTKQSAPANPQVPTPSTLAETALLVQRIVLCGIIAAHGWARLLADAVTPFGAWLDGLGLPLGAAVAWAVTAIEILGTPLLLLGRLAFVLCLVYAAIYLAGLILVHAPEGWFVVGLGRNGMEYSVLLIVCLLSVAAQHRPGTGGASRTENTQ